VITVRGTIIARGTEGLPILFTSAKVLYYCPNIYKYLTIVLGNQGKRRLGWNYIHFGYELFFFDLDLEYPSYVRTMDIDASQITFDEDGNYLSGSILEHITIEYAGNSGGVIAGN
jgi:hypothetical protein